MILKNKTTKVAALKSDMSEKTARKNLRSDKLPRQMKTPHDRRTRKAPFEEVWEGIRQMLIVNPGLEAKTLFEIYEENIPVDFRIARFELFKERLRGGEFWKVHQKRYFSLRSIIRGSFVN